MAQDREQEKEFGFRMGDGEGTEFHVDIDIVDNEIRLSFSEFSEVLGPAMLTTPISRKNLINLVDFFKSTVESLS